MSVLLTCCLWTHSLPHFFNTIRLPILYTSSLMSCTFTWSLHPRMLSVYYVCSRHSLTRHNDSMSSDLHPPHVHHAADTNLNRNSSFLTKILAFIIGQTFTALLDAHFESFRILFPISARMESRSHIQTLPVYQTFRRLHTLPFIQA